MTGRADYLDLGGYNAVCYFCGRKRKAGELVKYWQGFYVCRAHWEERQPQDFVHAIVENPTPPWTQPMPADQFVYFCTINGRTGIAGVGVAGCAVAGFIAPGYDPNADSVA